MRLFVALHPPAGVMAELEAAAGRLQAADAEREVRWVRSSGIHLTLQFLGEVQERVVAGIGDALDEVAGRHAAPRLGLGAPGSFPNPHRPRVIWVGLWEEGTTLAALRADVGATLGTLGWPAEPRAFQPHLTVGRRRDPNSRASLSAVLAGALATPRPNTPAVPWPRLALVESRLGPGGSQYTDAATWTLGASPRPDQGAR